jgi:hypothetical protein
MSDLDNFKAWYVDVLTALYPMRNAGIAVFMLSLPLAERYLRQKNNLGPDAVLDDAFMRNLCAICASRCNHGAATLDCLPARILASSNTLNLYS